MRALKKWSLGGLACGLIYACVVYAPASWLASLLEERSEGRITLHAPRGTLWQGSADMVLSGGVGSSGATKLSSRLNWHIRPAWRGLDVTLSAACCTLESHPAQLEIRLGYPSNSPGIEWQLSAEDLALPAQLLAGLGAPWNTLQLTGELLLKSDQLAGVWSVKGLQFLTGRASLRASRFSTALSTVQPLGSYLLSIAGSTLRLETLTETSNQAALLLSGTGQVGSGQTSFQGVALAASGNEEALSNLLHIIGQWDTSVDGRASSILKL